MITVHITRGEAGHGASHIDVFTYDGDMTITVADYLTLLNRDKALRTDVNGKLRPPVIWDCGCLEGKCGACAMVINGVPRLACRSFLDKVGRRGSITIGPLSKFPLICDLSVSKDEMFETLKKRQIWTEKAVISEDTETRNLIYKSGQCLECGCCLEVCPNFKGIFDGRGDNAFPGPIYAAMMTITVISYTFSITTCSTKTATIPWVVKPSALLKFLTTNYKLVLTVKNGYKRKSRKTVQSSGFFV